MCGGLHGPNACELYSTNVSEVLSPEMQHLGAGQLGRELQQVEEAAQKSALVQQPEPQELWPPQGALRCPLQAACPCTRKPKEVTVLGSGVWAAKALIAS